MWTVFTGDLDMLIDIIVVLEYNYQLHKKVYNFLVCEFGSFESVLHDVGACAIRLLTL